MRILPFVLASVVSAAPVLATTRVVNTTSDTSGPNCPLVCSLREAIASSQDGDHIVFAPTLGNAATIVLQQGEIVIDRALIIDGPGAQRLAISGNGVGRIFRIERTTADAFAVSITDLSLIDGAANASNGSRPQPEPAEGGAIKIGSNANVLLRRIEFRHNRAFGGAGAEGAFPLPGTGTDGEIGGDGGDARGGAIANAGSLDIAEALFLDNRAVAGIGGNGGHGASGVLGGQGGVGGRGGDALGGAIYSSGNLIGRNLGFLGNEIAAQRGGIGGDGGPSPSGNAGNGGDGGHGGYAAAAALYVAAGLADLSFISVAEVKATVAASTARGGFAGGIGALNGVDGLLGASLSQALTDFGAMRLKHSLISAGTGTPPACGPLGQEPVSVGIVSVSDASCGGISIVDGELAAAFGTLESGSNGVRTLALRVGSAYVDATADCTLLGGALNGTDARGQSRPSISVNAATPCDLGAFERDGNGLFAHGFEE